MSRSRGDPQKRVKTARGRTASSNRWLERQLNDPYVREAKAAGYRSRAAFKLIELDEKFGILRGAERIVDLGIAPGGWSQIAQKKRPQATIVGIDLLPTEPLDGVTILEMDFMADEAPETIMGHLGGPPDLVMSDMAANTVGFAIQTLAPGGQFLAKVLAGGTDAQLLALLKKNFKTVKHAKPPASRKGSSEWYVVAQGFKGRD